MGIRTRNQDEEEEEVVISRVNGGVQAITELQRADATEHCVEQMNLYGNNITRLDGLDLFTGLVELCLSNNAIEEISFHALDPLKQLRVLDLSANRISRLRGLPLLPRLEELSLAHNRLSSLDGILRPVKVPKLKYFDLRSNAFDSVVAFTPLQHLSGLTHLRLQSRDGLFANPLCDHVEYPHVLLDLLPTLTQLDEEDTEFLEEVGKVHMPKYQSIMKRIREERESPKPAKPTRVKQRPARVRRDADGSTTHSQQRVRIFAEAEDRIGYTVTSSKDDQMRLQDIESPENAIPPESNQAPPPPEVAPPPPPASVPPVTTVQRIVMRDASTNTELDLEKEVLQREAATIEKETAMLRREREYLDKETLYFIMEKEFQLKVQKLQEDASSAENRTTKAEAEAVRLSSLLIDREQKLREAQAELAKQSTSQQSDADEMNQKLREELARLQELHQHSVMQAKEKEMDLQQHMKIVFSELGEKTSALEKANELLRQKEQELKTKAQEAHEASKALQDQSTERDSKLQDLRVQLQESNSRLEDTVRQNGLLRKQLDELKASREQYQEECLRKDQHMYRLKKEVLAKSEEVDDVKAQLVKAADRQERLQQQQQQIYDKQLQASIVQLEMEFRREHQNLTDKFQTIQRKYQESVKQYLRLKAAYETCLKREVQQRDEIQRLTAVIHNDQQKIVQQDAKKREEYEVQLQRLQDEKTTLQDGLNQSKEKLRQIPTLQAEMEEQQQLVSRLRQEMNRLQDETRVWERKEGDLKAAIKVKDVMLDDQLRQIEELRKQYKQLKKDYDQDTGDLQAHMEDLENALDDHIQKLAGLDDQHEVDTTALTELKDKVSKFDEERAELEKQVELKDAALGLIETELDRMRGLLSNQDALFQKRLQKHLDRHQEELERTRSAAEEALEKLRIAFDEQREDMVKRYQKLANDLKDVAAQNTKLRVQVEQEKKKNAQNDHDMRVLLAQIDRERQVKKESLKHIRSLFEQLQQDTP
ncbi:hypothetical protein Poli38472_005214 [Pythium oligandrum]|uniref:Leucine-rich repeat and coiled-coil domain-containing protein 1 n=1 Tax=Pythium oligandrum TaxID=41045 RepID=A0A8K1FHD4_PYTOL|nr:hypothetical protein Poli38472_005214 [Pythium oligandrum]|eukprot:TMW62596.1 hypothetical protein Poli38472_005214 [Pythium oligandrum]